MPDPIFTAITFSPVTEFIEKTRKLRDLYGSSFILSYLAESVCQAAQQALGEESVISPALLNITMGTPDQIVIQGYFPKQAAREAFLTAWGNIMDACQAWIERNCEKWISEASKDWVSNGEWNRTWQQWKTHAWEFFWVKAETIPDALDALAEAEGNYRNWVGINWMGESSTLSGADAIAWPGLDRNIPAKRRSMAEADEQIRSFFQELNRQIGAAILSDELDDERNPAPRLRALARRYDLDPRGREIPTHPEYETLRQEVSEKLGEAIVTNREQLSIPELTKRLTTLKAVAESPALNIQFPESFRDVNLRIAEQPMGWFRGDGDQAGHHIRSITRNVDTDTAVANLRDFSTQMRQWAKQFQQSFDQHLGRVVFAGGDDFLGVFYAQEHPTAAIEWLCRFKEEVWHVGENGMPDRKPITPSIGFVWASPQVPQRDILQHCEQAERAAKDSGRDRICLRVLFASGTYLDWTCPWWFLPRVVDGYRDRNSRQDWTHIYKDIAELKARHAFRGNHQVALALFNLFFHDPTTQAPLLPVKSEDLFKANSPLWTQPGEPDALTGILSDELRHQPFAMQQDAFNDWVISLAEVGFYLFNRDEIAPASYSSAA